MLRKLKLADMDAAARVHRTAFDHASPTLAGLHTPQEDRWFFRERVFKTCEVWGAFDGDAMTGMLAFREDWIDQLYILPEVQERGLGTAVIAGRAKCLRSPAALDVPAQRAGAALLRSKRLCADPGDRRRAQRGEGAGCALSLETGLVLALPLPLQPAFRLKAERFLLSALFLRIKSYL
jgi:hypothetical protein